MAVSIVNDPLPASPIPGVTKSTRWICDVFRGSIGDLLAAGLITPDQLEPQAGRRPGYTVFLPDGAPCPMTRRAWRQPGYKAISQLEDGSYVVELTVSREVQAWRRKSKKAAEHEREQQRIDKELAEHGHVYKAWTLKHGYDAGQNEWLSEFWEGTKDQLQAEGIGVGMLFPGETGFTKKELFCKCSLGFDVCVYLPQYEPGKAAAGIYRALSRYLPEGDKPKQHEKYAPGVLREIWTPAGYKHTDFYYGDARSLVAAGLVPSVDLFPGQPGISTGRVTYRKGWKIANTSPHVERSVTIHRRGKSGQFCVEQAVDGAEYRRREAVCEREKSLLSQRASELQVERMKLRKGAQPEKSSNEFRTEREQLIEYSLKLLWTTVSKSDDGFSFDVQEGSEGWSKLADAFEAIRNVIRDADVVSDKKVQLATRAHLKLVASRNDKAFQSALSNLQRPLE